MMVCRQQQEEAGLLPALLSGILLYHRPSFQLIPRTVHIIRVEENANRLKSRDEDPVLAETRIRGSVP